MTKRGPVTQFWVHDLTWMQQSVLLTAIRGPDGLRKDHVAKLLCRWLRRCVLYSAFDGKVLLAPYDPGERQGGSFTGASCRRPSDGEDWQDLMDAVVVDYLRTTDETPHHFQLHLMHAAEILGYKHPTPGVRHWWRQTYFRMANDMHLNPETEEQMDRRLGDSEPDWRAAEEATARHP